MKLIHGKIYSMAGNDYEDGYIRFDGGKITAVGLMDELGAEDDEQVIDVKGQLVVPGFVEPHCHVGMWEDGLGFEGDDGNEDTDPSTPQLRALDAVNPLEKAFGEALRAGITTVVTGPGSANPIAGQICAVKTSGRRIDDMLIKAPIAMKFALGENPKTSYHARLQTPITRMATASIIREQLFKAKKYQELLHAAQEDEELEEPEYDAKCEALLPLLRGEIKAHIHAHRADDIFTAIRIAKEFGFDYVLVHCTEGHLIADLLSQEHVKAICGPIIGARTKPELAGATVANAAKLIAAGVEVAICTDHPELPVSFLTMSAQMAQREGMDYHTTLAAITINAARICDIHHRVGSIEAGKDADFAVFEADPLLGGKPTMVFVNGEPAYCRNENECKVSP